MAKYFKHKLDNKGAIRFDTLETLAKRYGITLGSDFKDRNRALKASQKIDQIREKCGSNGGKKLNAVESIRKWRNSR